MVHGIFPPCPWVAILRLQVNATSLVTGFRTFHVPQLFPRALPFPCRDPPQTSLSEEWGYPLQREVWTRVHGGHEDEQRKKADDTCWGSYFKREVYGVHADTRSRHTMRKEASVLSLHCRRATTRYMRSRARTLVALNAAETPFTEQYKEEFLNQIITNLQAVFRYCYKK